MLRAIMHQQHDETDSDGFRYRGLGFSRLDAFSDVVFGFALTLLVVSLEVPKNFEELHHLWGGFLPFGISFLLLMLVWYGHYTYFRRFGTDDVGTVWLNGLLLFVVLFYVYPLKFLFLAAFAQKDIITTADNMREVVLLFSGGLSAIYLLFSALYANAYRQRGGMALSPVETMLAHSFIWEEFGTGCIGLLVFLLAWFLPSRWAGTSCIVFMLIGLWKTFMGRRSGKAARRMHAQEHAAMAPTAAAATDAASMTSE